MKFTKLSLIAALAVTTMSTSAVAADEIGVSANVSVTNNYVWRGMTQSANKPAVQGGLDVEYGGLYLGTWASNVDFGSAATTEIDGYFGYGGELAGIGYDIGFIKFAYLNEAGANFEEAYLGLSKDFGVASLGVTYSIGMDDAPDDIAVEASVGLPSDYSLNLGFGDYDTYGTRYSAGVSKSFDKLDFSVGFHNYSPDASGADDEKNVVVSVGTGF